MSQRHDADAGGDRQVLAAKAAVRDLVWSRLEERGVTRFPGARHRISNFVGAEAAADRLRATPSWRDATTLKANPDSPQWPVRQRALEDGKRVYMAVPRLAHPEPFFVLDPDHLPDTPRRSSSIAGASRAGRTVRLDEIEPCDLVVTGCVAVGLDGVRLGKGGGFSDLEFAIVSALGLVDADTVVATTVHELQVLEAGAVPCTPHDVTVDLVVTPERAIWTRRGRRAVPRIDPGELTAAKIAAIPVLAALIGRDDG